MRFGIFNADREANYRGIARMHSLEDFRDFDDGGRWKSFVSELGLP